MNQKIIIYINKSKLNYLAFRVNFHALMIGVFLSLALTSPAFSQANSGSAPIAANIAATAPAAQQDINWTAITGSLSDIGVGANGVVWGVNSAQQIYRRTGSAWTQIPGSATRVSVDPKGNAWVVNAAGGIFAWNGSVWSQITGSLSDIGVGAIGVVWGVNAAQQIYRWTGSSWTQMPGAATRVSVDPWGNAWVVNAAGQIFRWFNDNWMQVPGTAKDIAACHNGDVYVVGTDNAPYKWSGTNFWEKKSGTNLLNIACDLAGMVYATTISQGIIFGATNTSATVAASQGVAAPAISNLQGTALAAKNASEMARNAAAKLANAHILAAAKEADVRYAANQLQIAQTDAGEVRGRSAAMASKLPLRWVKGATANPVIVGYESNRTPRALCRAESRGGLFPGKIVDNRCNIAVNGKEVLIYDFESAVGTIGWKTASNGQSSSNAVIAGWSIPQFQWAALPGTAVDIGVGGDGQAWMVNSANEVNQWNGANWTQRSQAATRIAADAEGNAWIVKPDGKLGKLSKNLISETAVNEVMNNRFGPSAKPALAVEFPDLGKIIDVGVGANGTVWAVNSDQKIYRWSGADWPQMTGAAVRVSVDPDGNAWVISAAGNIYQWLNSNWVQRPGFARDIAACGNGDIYVVGTDSILYKFNGSSWDKMPGSNLLNIACDAKGRIFATLTGRQIGVATFGSLNPKIDELAVCRTFYNGGLHPGKLYSTNCVITYGGKEISSSEYQVAVDLGVTAPKLNSFMVQASSNSESKALVIRNRLLNDAAVAKTAAVIALKEYKDAIARAAVAQITAGTTQTTQFPSGEINYVAMVGGSPNLGRGVNTPGAALVNYGVNGQLPSSGVSGQYSYVAQFGESLTYGDANYNTTISGLAKYENSISGCAEIGNNSACLQVMVNNTASLTGAVQSNAAVGGGTMLTYGGTGTLSVGYYGKAGFESGPSGASGGFTGEIGYQAKAEYNYSIVNDGYGGAGVKAGVSAGGLSGGGSGSATYTDGTLKVEACGSAEALAGVDLCINGQVNIGAAYEALSPTVLQGANFLVEDAPGIYRTSSNVTQGTGVMVYKTGDKVTRILAAAAVGSANQVANSSITTANNIASGSVRAIYSAGGITATAANKIINDGPIAAEVLSLAISRTAAIQDIAKNSVNVVVPGMTGVGNAIVSGVTSFGNKITDAGSTFGGGVQNAVEQGVGALKGAIEAVNPANWVPSVTSWFD